MPTFNNIFYHMFALQFSYERRYSHTGLAHLVLYKTCEGMNVLINRNTKPTSYQQHEQQNSREKYFCKTQQKFVHPGSCVVFVHLVLDEFSSTLPFSACIGGGIFNVHHTKYNSLRLIVAFNYCFSRKKLLCCCDASCVSTIVV